MMILKGLSLTGYDSDSTPLAMIILKGLSYWLW